MSDHFVCEKCNKSFQSLWGLKRHVRKSEHSECKPMTIGYVTCDKCKKSFRNQWYLKRHHGNTRECKSNACVVCEKCNRLFQSEWHLKRHTEECNGSDLPSQELKKEHYKFNSMTEFTEWKEKMERETSSHFVKHRGAEKNKDGSITFNLYCHRSGFYIPRGKQERSLKTKGSNKIDSHCPSVMKVTEGTNVTVQFIGTHIGHSNHVGRLYLKHSEPASEKQPRMLSPEPPRENDIFIAELSTQVEIHSQDDIEIGKRLLIESYTKIITQMVHSQEGLRVAKKHLSAMEFMLKTVD